MCEIELLKFVHTWVTKFTPIDSWKFGTQFNSIQKYLLHHIKHKITLIILYFVQEKWIEKIRVKSTMHNTKSEWYKRATGKKQGLFWDPDPGVIAYTSLV